MVKLELLSPNLILILEELLKNRNLCKYLVYNTSNPLSGANITNTKTLLFKQLFPYPFYPLANQEDGSQLHVYYPSGKIENKVIGDTQIYFDIVVAKGIWLINDGTNAQIRPYMIMKEIINILDDKSLLTVGSLHFSDFRHIFINDKFDCLRLITPMTTFEKQIR